MEEIIEKLQADLESVKAQLAEIKKQVDSLSNENRYLRNRINQLDRYSAGNYE